MKKVIVAIAALGLMCTGCAWLGWGDDDSSQTTTSSTAQAAEAAPEATTPPAPVEQPKKIAKAKSSTAKKGAKSESQIKAELDQMGRKLVAQSSRTLLPNKANKEVKKVGNQWVATYVSVDTKNVSTEMRPGNAGQYVGFIRYQEHIYECRGATRQEALNAPCNQVRARNMNELIRYDGHAWQD